MRQLRFLHWPTYFIASLLLFVPLLDLLVTTWPLQPSNLRWRVATMGQVSGSLVLALVGLLVLLIASVLFEQPRVQRALAALNGLVAAALLVLLPLFLLDLAQLRPEVRPDAAKAFDLVATQSAIKLLAELVALVSLTIAAFKLSRAGAERVQKRSGRADPLVSGVRGTDKGAAATP